MSYVGQPIKRLEDPRLLMGQGTFVDDLHVPDMLYAVVLRSVYAHARIDAIDASAARRLPGMVQVVTAQDLIGKVKDIPPRASLELEGVAVAEHPVLVRDKVCYVGQPVAVVVAHDRYLARDALDRIEVDYQSLPSVMDPWDAAQEGAMPIHEAFRSNVAMRIREGRGDVQAAFAQANAIIRPTMEVECLGVLTNKPPTGPYRGAGGPEGAFFMERTIDLIAHELSLDPSEVRKRNCILPEDFPYRTATGLIYDSGDFLPSFERALELVEYDSFRQQQQARELHQSLIGIGVATVVKASGGRGEMKTSQARVSVEPTGHIKIYTEVSPHGQGTGTTFAQIAADELGVRVEDIQVLHGDTDMLPAGQGTFASRGLTIGGSAVYVGLREARQKMARIAARFLECPSEAIVFQGRRVFDRHYPDQALTFSQVAAAAHRAEGLPDGMEPGLECLVSFILPENPFGFAAHIAVIEIDRATGEVQFLRYAAVHDFGWVINPTLLAGQVHGAIAQWIGPALTEAMTYSPDGQPLTGSLLDYAILSADEVPVIHLDIRQTPSPTNPLGVKGIGELPTVAAPVAVANAVMDALTPFGIRHLDLPLTAEKTWRAMQRGST